MHGLTDQQLKVVKMIARGYVNKQIAAELRMSKQTVYNCVAKIFKIYHAKTRAEVVSVFVARFLDSKPIDEDSIDELYKILGVREKKAIAV